MRFIRKDFDKRLLFLLVSMLVLLILFLVYYEINYRKLLSKYDKNQEIFGGLTANAVLDELNKTSSMKEAVLKYREYFEKRYTELLIQNENLNSQIESLKSELTLIKSQEEYQKVRDGGPVSQFRLIQEKNMEISRLKERISSLCLKLNSYNISEKGC